MPNILDQFKETYGVEAVNQMLGVVANQAIESSQRIVNGDTYQNDEVEFLIKKNLPKNAELLPADLTSDPAHHKYLENVLAGFANADSPYQQLFLPTNLGNGSYSLMHLTKDENNRPQVSYFDPVGVNTPYNKLEPITQEQALRYSSIPGHLVAAVEKGLKISKDEIAITTNRLQYSFFNADDENKRYNSNEGGAIVVDTAIELAKGTLKVAGNKGEIAGLATKTADGKFQPVANIAPEQMSELAHNCRKSHLSELKNFLNQEVPNRAAEISSFHEPEIKKERANKPVTSGIALPYSALFITSLLASAGVASATQNLRGDVTTQNLPTPITKSPSPAPTAAPTQMPTFTATFKPSSKPTRSPTFQPTSQPTSQPSAYLNNPLNPDNPLNQENCGNDGFSRQLISFIIGTGLGIATLGTSAALREQCGKYFCRAVDQKSSLCLLGYAAAIATVTTVVGAASAEIDKATSNKLYCDTSNSIPAWVVDVTNNQTGEYAINGAIAGLSYCAVIGALRLIDRCNNKDQSPSGEVYKAVGNTVGIGTEMVGRANNRI